MTLSVLAAKFPEVVEGFSLFGIVKETGVDDEGLVDFKQNHYNYPLYKDETLGFYKALGDRRMGAFSLLKLFSNFSMMRRIKKGSLEGNMVGEGLVQGGVIIFDKNGKSRAMYAEKTGSELPLKDIASALSLVRNGEIDEK